MGGKNLKYKEDVEFLGFPELAHQDPVRVLIKPPIREWVLYI